MTRFIRRLIGSVVLDAATYEDVEADRSATWQAMIVVLLSAVATGVGAHGFGIPLSVVPVAAIAALFTWAAWALLTYEIGVRLLPTADTRSDVGELMRTIGFASGPGLLRVFGVIPELATATFVLTSVWMLFAMVVAVRQALDFSSTVRALAVCVVGWTLMLGFLITLGYWVVPTLLFAQHSIVSLRAV